MIARYHSLGKNFYCVFIIWKSKNAYFTAIIKNLEADNECLWLKEQIIKRWIFVVLCRIYHKWTEKWYELSWTSGMFAVRHFTAPPTSLLDFILSFKDEDFPWSFLIRIFARLVLVKLYCVEKISFTRYRLDARLTRSFSF